MKRFFLALTIILIGLFAGASGTEKGLRCQSGTTEYVVDFKLKDFKIYTTYRGRIQLLDVAKISKIERNNIETFPMTTEYVFHIEGRHFTMSSLFRKPSLLGKGNLTYDSGERSFFAEGCSLQ